MTIQVTNNLHRMLIKPISELLTEYGTTVIPVAKMVSNNQFKIAVLLILALASLTFSS